MANRALMKCRVAGCETLVTTKYCGKHQHDNPRSNQTTNPCYLTTAWRKCTKWIQNRNPVCQKINNGVQCMRLSTLTHHLISPRVAPDRLLDPTNLVALCARCHPREDTPNWKPGIDFVPTEFSISL
jgi:hypothetical protein